MDDVRSHILYLCAVFLMLGFGIIIGASFFGPDQVKKQSKTIAAIRLEANTAVQQGQLSQDRLRKVEQTLDTVRPYVVRGKLAGERVVVVQTGDYPQATQSAIQALTDSGAYVAATVVVGDGWATMDPTAASTDFGELATALTAGMSGNDPLSDELHALEDQSLVTVKGDLTAPTNDFVIVGGGKDPTIVDNGLDVPNEVDAPLIQHLIKASDGDAHIVGCESLNAAVSFIPAYQNAGIPTVDCVDEPVGALALPFALRGGQDADDYGVKPTARRLTPPSLSGVTSS